MHIVFCFENNKMHSFFSYWEKANSNSEEKKPHLLKWNVHPILRFLSSNETDDLYKCLYRVSLVYKYLHQNNDQSHFKIKLDIRSI